jgi:hypothetical protein
MGNDLVAIQDVKIKASIREAIRKLTEGAGPDDHADASKDAASGKTSEPGPAN